MDVEMEANSEMNELKGLQERREEQRTDKREGGRDNK